MAAAPLLLPAATAGRAPFLAVLGLLLATDGLDGYLARRLGAITPRGALLDSVADHVMCACAFAGAWRLWPGPLNREASYVALIAAAYGLPVLYALLRFGRLLSYHTLLSRIAGIAMTAALLPLLYEWSGLPFRIAAIVEVGVALEYVTISILLPEHRGPVRSLLAVRRLAGPPQARSVDPVGDPP
ncbi:MAG: CDP-alcohol phosphatidyltransferase [Gemmatimonadales bacterium]|nr:CDP-alcohol phosphatidyltransferase [Gemmatimonadales bacterium]